MKNYLCLLLFILTGGLLRAQLTDGHKKYPGGAPAGDVLLMEQWSESDGKQSSVYYLLSVPASGNYHLSAVTNMIKGAAQWLTLDGKRLAANIKAVENGWQQSNAAGSRAGAANSLYLAAGRHTLQCVVAGNMPPLNDAISLSLSGAHKTLDDRWKNFSARINRWQQEQPLNNAPAPDKNNPGEANKILSNPEANYEHAIDTGYSYSTFQLFYLVAGTQCSFSTYGSTIDPVLHLFDVSAPDTRSWYSDDSYGTWESNILITVPVSGTYALLARPYYGGANGLTNIKHNGEDMLLGTPLGGHRFATLPRTGNLNYFTTKLTGAAPDTRIFTITAAAGTVTGYNDDYKNSTGGTWDWGYASRIRKNYSSASGIVYVCAYGPGTTGACDVYMGNTNATSAEGYDFPLLKAEDAIQTAPSSGTYNCISWSGGITTSWTWPPDVYSPWYVAGNPLAGFDKFYANTPARYPGAWNYTRSGATLTNAAVDLWKRASGYTHASVTKPGNNHPHGYDWESKPGNYDRTMHPRNALNNANVYGAVSDYYRFSFNFSSKMTGNFETDADAIKAGVAVLDRAALTTGAQEKLTSLTRQTDAALVRRFNELYSAWDKTKAANGSLSDPAAYCRNAEFEALAALAKTNAAASLPLVMDKFVNSNDHFIGQLLWTLTENQYGKLLNEVKAERAATPNDKLGRYKIHGDHDNGVLYVEKILAQLEAKPVDISPAVSFTVTASPNPVKDVLTVTVELKESSRISVSAVSAQTRMNKQLQQEITVLPGTYRYRLNMTGFAGAAGDVITVQVKVNGVLQTAKVMVQ